MSQSHRTPRALTRFVLTLFVALLALGAPPALADPTAGPPRKPALPVTVTFTQISPALSSDDSPIKVTARLTNTGSHEITEMWTRLQRDRRIDSRAKLLAVDRKQPSYGAITSNDTNLDITLGPGETKSIELTVPRADLAISDSGAYPILLNLQGSINGQEGRVGQGAFTLPRMVTAAAPLSVAWVLPLIDRPHLTDVSGLFTDDELAASIKDGGRLDVILSAAEKHGAAANVTLILDPALIDELAMMAHGYQVDNGDDAPKTGTGKDDASKFLDRLRAVADTTPIAITPYADVDVVALDRAGLGSVIAQARERGEQIVSDLLQTTPRTDLAWPADGIITEAAATNLRADDVRSLLLSGASFGQDEYLASDDQVTEDAATSLPGISAVVADPGLSRLLGEGTNFVAGPDAATQRVAAELAIIALQAPERARNVVLLPPRDWKPSSAFLDGLMTMTTTSPWLTPTSLADVEAKEPVNRGALQYPASLSARELPQSALAELAAPHTQIAELGPAFGTDDQQQVVLDLPHKLLDAAASSAWRGAPAKVSEGATAALDALYSIRGLIRIVTPSNGSYTLAASDAPLVFTVENNLPVPVKYRIGLDPRRSSGLEPEDIGVQEIAARSRATVKLPTKVTRSGTFSVVAQISTPEGKPLGRDIKVKVTSSAYGAVALAVTAAALLLLLTLIGRRWWKRRLFQQAEARERAARGSSDSDFSVDAFEDADGFDDETLSADDPSFEDADFDALDADHPDANDLDTVRPEIDRPDTARPDAGEAPR